MGFPTVTLEDASGFCTKIGYMPARNQGLVKVNGRNSSSNIKRYIIGNAIFKRLTDGTN